MASELRKETGRQSEVTSHPIKKKKKTNKKKKKKKQTKKQNKTKQKKQPQKEKRNLFLVDSLWGKTRYLFKALGVWYLGPDNLEVDRLWLLLLLVLRDLVIVTRTEDKDKQDKFIPLYLCMTQEPRLQTQRPRVVQPF